MILTLFNIVEKMSTFIGITAYITLNILYVVCDTEIHIQKQYVFKNTQILWTRKNMDLWCSKINVKILA